jgi:hypothetical protein
MSKTGRAAVYDKPNAPFVIREFPVRDVHRDQAFAKAVDRSVLRAAIIPESIHILHRKPGLNRGSL